jgi:mannose-6-phosphate isomerase-like protein (cupin superfamily)
MSYPPVIHAGEPEQSAWLQVAGSPADVTYPNGNRVRYLARGDETGGTYGLYHWEFAGPVSGPGPHLHRTMTESFYVLNGTVTIHEGRGWQRCGAGDFVHVPAGGVHGFRNEDGPAAMLLHFAPGAPREAYFEGLARGLGDLSPQEHDAFMAEHDNLWL